MDNNDNTKLDEAVSSPDTKDEMILNGYIFKGRADFERALKEYDTIEKLKPGINPESLDNIKKVYLKLTSKNYFSTPIGISFLHEMQSYLEENGVEVPLVPVPKVRAAAENNSIDFSHQEEEIQSLYNELNKEKSIRNKFLIAIVALAFTVIAMIFMVMTNDNLGYYKAEEKVLNKYSSWEEELNKKEKELKDIAEELGIKLEESGGALEE